MFAKVARRRGGRPGGAGGRDGQVGRADWASVVKERPAVS